MNKANVDALTREALDHYFFPLVEKRELKADGPLLFTRAKGREITDAAGKTYLDMMSTQTRANSLGYGNEEIARAVYEQLLKLHYAGTVYQAADVTVQLSAKIASLAPGDLNVTLFAGSGSEANEMSIKFAKQYHYHKGTKKRAYKIIARLDSYHGATMGAQAATDFLGTRHISEPGVPGYSHIPPPTCYRCPFGLSYPDCGVLCARWLEKQIQHEGPEFVAAFIAEPVMQGNGTQVPPPEYFPIIREICDKYDVLFIGDEVITGFGRTGEWFALQHWNVVPDIMSTAKAITSGYFPLGASTVSQKVADALPIFLHIQTYNGHPGGMAAALKTIEICERDGLIRKCKENGKYLLDALKGLERLAIVGQVRGLGSWVCIDFTPDKKTRPLFTDDTVRLIQREMRRLGVLAGSMGTAIEMAPSYTATKPELDRAVAVAEEAIRTVMRQRNLG